MATVLEQLVNHYPRPRYLENLAAVRSELGQARKQLALNEVLYEQGLLVKPQQLRNLASLYLLNGLPYKGALVLANAIDAGQLQGDAEVLGLLAQSWSLAGEPARAVEPLARAAQLTADGEAYLRLGQVHVELQRWSEVEQAFSAALDRRTLRDPALVWMMLGMVRYHLKSYPGARQAFAAATGNSQHAAAAARWIAYLGVEEDRIKQLQGPDRQPDS